MTFLLSVAAVGSADVVAVGSADVAAVDSADVDAVDSADVAAVESADVVAVGSADVVAVGSTDVAAVDSADVAAVDSADVAAVESADVAAVDSADVAADGGVPGVAPIDCLHAVAGVPTVAGYSSFGKNYKAQQSMQETHGFCTIFIILTSTYKPNFFIYKIYQNTIKTFTGSFYNPNYVILQISTYVLLITLTFDII
jgi:hypothetical protein